MHGELTEQTVSCPYCGESLTILLDTSAGGQSYVEDCQVCCRPMNVSFTCVEGRLEELTVRADG